MFIGNRNSENTSKTQPILSLEHIASYCTRGVPHSCQGETFRRTFPVFFLLLPDLWSFMGEFRLLEFVLPTAIMPMMETQEITQRVHTFFFIEII